VIAIASTANQETLQQLGADQAIDYAQAKFEERVKEVDVVLDTAGKDTLTRSYDVVKKGGIVVTIAGRPDEAELDTRGIRGAVDPERTEGRNARGAHKATRSRKDEAARLPAVTAF
jgi:NADPH:quinone reductase-like Zn-dependent oxidoreductase